jgi:type II secretory pathway predicted ATPase ExeA
MQNAPNLELSLLARQWGATAVPFGALTPEAWLDTPPTQRARTLLDQTASLRSVMLLAGPNGVGKSALVGRWVQSLDRRLFHPVVLTHATLSGSNLLSTLTRKLGQPAVCRRDTNLALIEAALAQFDRLVPVLVLDEAQNYSHASLEEVRLLLGLNLAEPAAFALLLVGDEYLLSTLRLRHHRALYSRIGSHHSLRPWNATEVAQYLQRSLTAVGLQPDLFEPAALTLLTSASAGLPRSLCLLARTAWIQAASLGAQRIEPAHVQHAIDTVPGATTLALPPQPEASHA